MITPIEGALATLGALTRGAPAATSSAGAASAPDASAPPPQPPAVGAAMLAAAIKQSGLAQLLADLSQAIDLSITPPAVREAAQQVIGRALPSDSPPAPADIRQALDASGLFLEASLAAGRPAPDLKSDLLTLRQALQEWVAVAPPTEALAAPASSSSPLPSLPAATPTAPPSGSSVAGPAPQAPPIAKSTPLAEANAPSPTDRAAPSPPGARTPGPVQEAPPASSASAPPVRQPVAIEPPSPHAGPQPTEQTPAPPAGKSAVAQPQRPQDRAPPPASTPTANLPASSTPTRSIAEGPAAPQQAASPTGAPAPATPPPAPAAAAPAPGETAHVAPPAPPTAAPASQTSPATSLPTATLPLAGAAPRSAPAGSPTGLQAKTEPSASVTAPTATSPTALAGKPLLAEGSARTQASPTQEPILTETADTPPPSPSVPAKAASLRPAQASGQPQPTVFSPPTGRTATPAVVAGQPGPPDPSAALLIATQILPQLLEEPVELAAATSPQPYADAAQRSAVPAQAAALAAGAIPPPPIRGGATTAQRAARPSLPVGASAETIARRLLQETQGALAREELMQIASINEGEAGPSWMFELPFMTPQGPATAQFQISRDPREQQRSADEDAGPTWRARFSVDIEPVGPVHASVAMAGERTTVMLWAEREASARLLHDEEPQLSAALRNAGLDPEVAVQAGSPRRAAPAPGRLLDQSS